MSVLCSSFVASILFLDWTILLNITLVGIANSANILVDLDDIQQGVLNRFLSSSLRVSCRFIQHKKNCHFVGALHTQIKHKIYF